MPRFVSKIIEKVARGASRPSRPAVASRSPSPCLSSPLLHFRCAGPRDNWEKDLVSHPIGTANITSSSAHPPPSSLPITVSFPPHAYTSEESDEDEVCSGAFHTTTAPSSVPAPIWSTEVVSTTPRGERIMALLDLLHEGGVVTMGVETKATTKVLPVEVVEVSGGSAESKSPVEATKKSKSKSGWMRRLKDVSVKKLKAAC
ncbi:hypothetical protein PM082_008540 [Marasmius tenuissimus]|nr:hypothetical protein PM082_008540 [Marasmius tenuissimus]